MFRLQEQPNSGTTACPSEHVALREKQELSITLKIDDSEIPGATFLSVAVQTDYVSVAATDGTE